MIKCWYYRKIISSCADAHEPLPAPVQEHVGNCPACREHHVSETRIARELSESAAAQREAPSAFLHGKIMARISRSHAELESDLKPGRLAWTIAVATACLIVSGILWLRSVSGGKDASMAGLASPQIDSEPATPLGEWAAKLDEPLETEMKLVLADTRTAMDSLVATYLPGELRPIWFEPAQN
jgi:hypothetical protein